MKNELTTYLDGATYRLHNKRISFTEAEGKVVISFQYADKDADKPACLHNCKRGKVRETFIKMTDEAMQALVVSYIEFRKSKNQILKL